MALVYRKHSLPKRHLVSQPKRSPADVFSESHLYFVPSFTVTQLYTGGFSAKSKLLMGATLKGMEKRDKMS